MSAKGLDEAGRNYIAGLVERGNSGDYVRDAVTHRVRSNDWDYHKNLRFLDWLRSKGYDRTAELLARYMDG